MPVRYTPPTPESLLPVAGIALGPAAGRIKNWQRDDVLLVTCTPGTVAAGVFTRNRCCAAPVTVCREHLAHQHKGGAPMRALVVNAGNANAGTGQPGLNAARQTCAAVGQLIGCAPEEVLPYSTGVIMEPLPVDRVVAALPAALSAAREDGWYAAARAIMTTDTVPKGASRRVVVDGVPVTVTGIAKGAGMIHPNMATMLAFMATDAPISADVLGTIAREVADVSFNGATVDGDTSTNDIAVVLASGAADAAPIRAEGADYEAFRGALTEAARRIAQMIVRDGEGATRTAEVRVEGARTAADADRVARTIAESPLVKTALHGGDPNWGRVLAAVGRAGVPVDIGSVDIFLGDVWVAEGGQARLYDEAAARRAVEQDPALIRVRLGAGHETGWIWTCDFSRGYVEINASYRS